MTYTNSSLISAKILSPNCNPRVHSVYNPTGVIDVITIHHVAGNCSIEVLGSLFANPNRVGSANYGIGSDGRIGLYVEEAYRAWTSDSPKNDYRAVTIEVANDTGAPNWHVSDKALASLINLVADICKRNNIKQINYTGNTSGNLTMHQMFVATTCPGPYLKGKFPYIAEQVNARLSASVKKTNEELATEVIRGEWGNDPVRTQKLTAAGYDAKAVQAIVDVRLGKTTAATTPAAPATPKPANPTTAAKIATNDLVSIKPGATYYNGADIPDWVNNDQWYVSSISGDRAVLGKNKSGRNNINSPVNTKYLTVVTKANASAAPAPAVKPKPAPASTASKLQVGDKVNMKSGAPVYGTTNGFADWVYKSTLYLRELSGSRAVISTQKTGAVTGAVDIKYLTKA